MLERPLTFSLSFSCLCEAGEELLAYLDDLYVITSSRRAREGLDLVASRVQEHCGIASNVGKTRVYNAGHGAPLPGMHELGDEVWRGNRPSGERGFTALGVPLGHPDYVRERGRRRVRDEQAFLEHLPQIPDLKCAWLLLLLRGSTRANHALRNILPDVVQPVGLPGRGGPAANLEALGCSRRTAPAAYWAAWADSLGYLGSRCPNLARACSDALARGGVGPWAYGAIALLLSQSGQQAAAWLTAVPADTVTTLAPEVMQIALRRRLRLRLPLGPATCGQEGHGCGRRLDACPRTGYLAKRAKLVERAWIAVCREAVGPEGHVVPSSG